MGAKSSKAAIAADVWRMMAEFTMSTVQRGRHFEALKKLGLTPGHLKALAVLERDRPLPMGAIADGLQCDPSMATWLIDRLEEHRLVERKMLATDRRVKTVVLTPRGVMVKDRLFEQLYEPPDDLQALDRETLERLRRDLTKLPRRRGLFPDRAEADVREATKDGRVLEHARRPP